MSRAPYSCWGLDDNKNPDHPHPDTVLIDFLEAVWRSTNIDVYEEGGISLGLSYDNGLLNGKFRADNLRDLLYQLRARLGDEERPSGYSQPK
jgi:hypothetical protein